MEKLKAGVPEEVILARVEQRTFELIDKFHGCGQCGLLAIQEVFGFEDPLLFKAASGLSGGLGGIHSTCGAFTSGVLALGLKYGRELDDLDTAGDRAFQKERDSFIPVAKLAKWFESEFGSLVCAEIRRKFAGADYDSSIPWQKKIADELGMGKHCASLAQKTAKKVAGLLINDAGSNNELITRANG